MLQPKRTKFRREQKNRMKGNAQRGNQLAFGSFGIKTLENCWLTAQQIEAARQAISRCMNREGQIWIRVFPVKPITKKPLDTRMGKGKGDPYAFVAPITPGRIIFEAEGVSLAVAKEAMRLGANQLPIATKFVVRRDYTEKFIGEREMKASEAREMSVADLRDRIEVEKSNLDTMKINHAISPLEDTSKIGKTRRDIALMITILAEKEKQN